MKMRSGPKVSGRSRRVAADQGWSLRGVPLYMYSTRSFLAIAYSWTPGFDRAKGNLSSNQLQFLHCSNPLYGSIDSSNVGRCALFASLLQGHTDHMVQTSSLMDTS